MKTAEWVGHFSLVKWVKWGLVLILAVLAIITALQDEQKRLTGFPFF